MAAGGQSLAMGDRETGLASVAELPPDEGGDRGGNDAPPWEAVLAGPSAAARGLLVADGCSRLAGFFGGPVIFDPKPLRFQRCQSLHDPVRVTLGDALQTSVPMRRWAMVAGSEPWTVSQGEFD